MSIEKCKINWITAQTTFHTDDLIQAGVLETVFDSGGFYPYLLLGAKWCRTSPHIRTWRPLNLTVLNDGHFNNSSLIGWNCSAWRPVSVHCRSWKWLSEHLFLLRDGWWIWSETGISLGDLELLDTPLLRRVSEASAKTPKLCRAARRHCWVPVLRNWNFSFILKLLQTFLFQFMTFTLFKLKFVSRKKGGNIQPNFICDSWQMRRSFWVHQDLGFFFSLLLLPSEVLTSSGLLELSSSSSSSGSDRHLQLKPQFLQPDVSWR